MLTKSVSKRLAHQPPQEPMFGAGLPLDGFDLLIGDLLDHLSEQHVQALIAACDVFARFSFPTGQRVQRGNVGFVRVNWALSALRKVIGNAHVTTDYGREALERLTQVRDILTRERDRRFPSTQEAA